MKKLTQIQSVLKAPKNQYNAFGKYKYRSCEDILEAVKPLLEKLDCHITISDQVKEVAGVVVIEASATIYDNETKESVNIKACAGVEPNRKGMDLAQSFGASSSYARKYALNGLLLIDDTKDSDNTAKLEYTTEQIKTKIAECTTKQELTKVWKLCKEKQQTELKDLFTTKGKEIENGLF